MCDDENVQGEDDDQLSVSDDSEPEERPCSVIFDPELDDGSEDDEVEVPAPAVQGAFSLKGGGSAFTNRTHNVFDCLDSLVPPTSSSSSSSSLGDGVFARPLAPPPSRNTTQPPASTTTIAKKSVAPDYLLHPERWTRYSLEDVPETSDQGNARAAISYLTSLKERKEEEEHGGDDSSACDLQHKMIYCRPKRPRRDPPAVRSTKETHLSHLQEEEEEEGEGEGEKRRAKAGRKKSKEETSKEGREVEKSAEQVSGDVEQVGRGKEILHEDREQVERAEEQIGKGEEPLTVFTTFKRLKSKNYRRSSGSED